MAKRIIAIDPGNTETAVVEYDPDSKIPFSWGKLPNSEVVNKLHLRREGADDTEVELVIEMVASYGMPVGRTVFDTVIWIGRFYEIWTNRGCCASPRLVVRRDVKMHLCHSVKANDANIRQALIDRFGGTQETAVGTKKKPGPLYKLCNDERAALALAITAAETPSRYEIGEQ